MNKIAYLEIANRLTGQIESGEVKSLPSITELARTNGVAAATMRKAIAVLEEKNLVSCCQGKKISLINVKGCADKHDGMSCQQLYEKISASIESGKLRFGAPLPKYDYYTLTYHVSSNTVSKAIARLAHDGLAHKQGKTWIAGSKKKKRAVSETMHDKQRPTVVIIANDEFNWVRFYEAHYPFRFTASFTNELEQYGVDVKLTFLAENELPQVLGIPTGMVGIESTIQQLGKNYIGCLMLWRVEGANLFEDIIEKLAGYDKPVVFFDWVDIQPELHYKKRQRKKRFFRLHFDESASIELALTMLNKAGHKRAGAVYICPKEGGKFSNSIWWIQRRLERIESIGKEKFGPMQFDHVALDREFWNFDTTGFMAGFFAGRTLIDIENEIQEKGGHTWLTIRDELKAHSKEIIDAVQKFKTTGFIGLNDHIAQQLFFLCKAIEIDIPHDCSLVSFDNLPLTSPFPISTIDPGFSRLGYLGAHLFLKDLRIHSDAYGNIAGIPLLIDRGSIGKARRR